MDFKLIASIAVVAFGFITLIINVWKMMPYRQITEIDQLSAAKDVLDKKSNSFVENLHPLTKELASKVIARSDFISAREMEYLLKLEDSHQCIKDFVISKNCFKPIAEKSKQELEFAGHYSSKRVRNCVKWLSVGLYFAFAFSAVLPFLVVEELVSSSYGFMLLVLMVPSAIYLAWSSGNFYVKIYRAEKLQYASKAYAIFFKDDKLCAD